MALEILRQLRNSLAESDSQARKEWARQIVDAQHPLENLLSLLHGDHKTAQRFTWLISDIGEADVKILEPCMPALFSLRDQMPFPGMHRGVAKWLLLTHVPQAIEKEAIEQMIAWLNSDSTCIASKSFSARVLFQLAIQKRIPRQTVKQIIGRQLGNKNQAFSKRMGKLLERLEKIE